MDNRLAVSILAVSILSAGCAGKGKPLDPTRLTPRMTKAQVLEVMGTPNNIKPAGEDKEILIYRKQTELIHVFLIKGKIKSIEHVRRRQKITY